jgi:hypothetical protein
MNAPALKRGRLNADDHSEIERLCASMKKPTPSKVARRMNRHVDTIRWYMLTHGLITRKPGRAPRPYKRNGRMIYPYAPEHDARITELRATNLTVKAIAETITREFGIARDGHSVSVRLVQLSAAPDEGEDQKEYCNDADHSRTEPIDYRR